MTFSLPVATDTLLHSTYPQPPATIEDNEHLAEADEDAGLCEANTTPAEGTSAIRRAEQRRKEHSIEPSETGP